MIASRAPARIVHLGLGAFYRAHACTYLQRLGGWGVLGVSLRSADVRDAMRLRNYRYTAAALTPDGMELQQIDVVRNVLVAPEDPAAVIAALADPAVTLVTMTVTEKGYCHDPAEGTLNRDHPVVIADIAQALPRTAPGYLVRGLQARRAAGIAPFTVLSCDNLPDNGTVTRAVTVELAREIDPELADWITEKVSFPSSMVDRIVPATTTEDIATIAKLRGAPDAAPVMHEPFAQWVITDDFKGDLPDLAAVGAQIVPDIAPFERMKLRMLNGAHSALAYLGCLAGFQIVAEAAADDLIAQYLQKLWHDEIIPTLTAPPDTSLEDYAAALHNRFTNSGIQHQLSQIAMDGSQKLPQRILGPVQDRLAQGGTIDALLLAVAGWIAYTAHQSPDDDPLSAELRNCHSDDPRLTVQNVLALSAVFDARLSARIMEPLSDRYEGLTRSGVVPMLAATCLCK